MNGFRSVYHISLRTRFGHSLTCKSSGDRGVSGDRKLLTTLVIEAFHQALISILNCALICCVTIRGAISIFIFLNIIIFFYVLKKWCLAFCKIAIVIIWIWWCLCSWCSAVICINTGTGTKRLSFSKIYHIAIIICICSLRQR